MRRIYSLKSYTLSLSLATFLVGCGGGGGGGGSGTTPTTAPLPSTYAVSGTVPGTIIEAYCSDGSFYTTTSSNNGTTEHPFSLSLPINAQCKLVMITNETASNPADYIITPIEIESDGIASTNLIIDNDINLGNVALEIPGLNSGWTPGVRTPLKVILNGKAVHVKSLSYDPSDTDNDGILNVYENDDNDSLSNKYDDDDDNDGVLDMNEISSDKDHDGINDDYDKDTDNDGIENSKDSLNDNHSNEDVDENNTNNTNPQNNNITLPSTFTPNVGRLLGSQCAQCHGTNGVSSSGIDSIKGENNLTHEIYDDDALMNAQANGYTSTEILAIESWLNNIQ